MSTNIENSLLSTEKKTRACRALLLRGVTLALAISSACFAGAQVNGVGQRPYLGWSTFSQQTIDGTFLTQANMQAQSDALHTSGLQAHGFNYINIDSGWMGSFDVNGRPIPNTTTFPDIKALVDHIHSNGQKAGIYWIPGIEQPAVTANGLILGTTYHIQDILVKPFVPGNSFSAGDPNPFHIKIDFTKPGAQEYINSVVNLFASWGIDFIKLDGVTPGSDHDDTSIDNRGDVEAWSKAVAQSGRAIWLTGSWELDQDYLSTWQQFTNARRIDQDVECEGNCGGLTDWPRVVLREYESAGWEHTTGPTTGWSDLDSLEVGNSTADGITPDEKQSAITIWSMANSPLYLGGDLTKLDDFAKSALSNDEVLAVDQSGHTGIQITGGTEPVWMADAGNGYSYIALYNFNQFPAQVTVRWSDLGFANATTVRDLWNHIDLGPSIDSFRTTIVGHGSRLLKVKRGASVTTPPGQVYEAESAVFNGGASAAQCTACSGGSKAGNIGGLGNTVTFNNVTVEKTGIYRMEVDALTQGPRGLAFTVNGGTSTTLNLAGGSFNLPQSTTVPVALQAGVNSILFYNSANFAADIDRIVISGDGREPAPTFTTYEAEDATLSGGASRSGCSYCSAGGKAGNLGGPGNNVTFNNVTVVQAGTYQLGIDYFTSGPRSFQITVNGAAPIQLDLNGTSFSSPASTVIAVQLQAGANVIQFGDDSFAPDLDSITVGPVVQSANLTGAITRKSGLQDVRLWQLTLNNTGLAPANSSRLNSFLLAPSSGDSACKASVLLPFPLPLGNIAPSTKRNVEVPILLTSACRKEDTFTLHTVFSANNGADVGTIVSTSQTR